MEEKYGRKSPTADFISDVPFCFFDPERRNYHSVIEAHHTALVHLLHKAAYLKMATDAHMMKPAPMTIAKADAERLGIKLPPLRGDRPEAGASARQIEQEGFMERDEVIFAFRRYVPDPKQWDVSWWTRTFPRYADDIRAQAAEIVEMNQHWGDGKHLQAKPADDE